MPIVFITGSSSGFGKACAEKFASHGYDLIINARRSERLMEVKAELESKYSTSVFMLPFDVRNKNEVVNAIHSLDAKWKQVDVLINNAGLAAGRDYFHEANIEDWEQMIDTNLKGLLYVTKCLINNMISNKRGHIINIGSLAGHEVYPQGNIYCATKHAVTALSKAMRIDLVQYGIKVTNISPGLAETEFSVVRFKGDAEKAKRVYEDYDALTAEDVAEVIYFAASRPAHVNIEELIILPTAQSDSRTVVRKH